MMQFLSQITGKQVPKEEVENKHQDVFLNHSSAGQQGFESETKESLFANALKKNLGLNALNSQAQEKHTNNKADGENEKTVQHPANFLFSTQPIMVQSTNEVGSGDHLQKFYLLQKNQKSVHYKSIKQAKVGTSIGKIDLTAAANAKTFSLGPIIKAGQSAMLNLNENGQLNAMFKNKAQILDGTANNLDDKTILNKIELSSTLGTKKTGKSVITNVADKNSIHQLFIKQHAVSKDDLATLKKLKLDLATSNQLENSDSTPQSRSQTQIKTSDKGSFQATSIGKTMQELADNAKKSMKIEQKAEKVLKKGREQNESVSGKRRLTAPDMQTNSITPTPKNSPSSFKNYLESQHIVELKINNSNNFKIANAENKQLDFNFEGGTEQLGAESKLNQDVKLNATFHQINSATGRRAMSVQVAQSIQRGLSHQSNNMELWQKHRFVFDDGKTLNISVRNTEGMLQLQLGTGNSELSKLIQQNLNELHGYLQQQLNINIDLNMQNFGSEQFENEKDSSNGQVSSTGMMESAPESGVMESSRNPTRYFGFNQKEWTA